MLKIQNGKPESTTTIRLSFTGWITLAVFFVSIVLTFASVRSDIENTKQNILILKETKLDKYEYKRDLEVRTFRDSLINCKLNKILKKLGVEE